MFIHSCHSFVCLTVSMPWSTTIIIILRLLSHLWKCPVKETILTVPLDQTKPTGKLYQHQLSAAVHHAIWKSLILSGTLNIFEHRGSWRSIMYKSWFGVSMLSKQLGAWLEAYKRRGIFRSFSKSNRMKVLLALTAWWGLFTKGENLVWLIIPA